MTDKSDRQDGDGLYGAEARPLLDHIADQKRRFQHVVLTFEQADLAVKCINFVVDTTVNEAMRTARSPARDGAEGAEPSRELLQSVLADISDACDLAGRRHPTETVIEFIQRVAAPPKPAPDAVREALEWIERHDRFWTSFPNENEVLDRSITGNVLIRGVCGRRAFAALAAPVPSRDGALIEQCAKIAESFRYSPEAKATTNGARTYGNDEACGKIAAAIRAPPPSPAVAETDDVLAQQIHEVAGCHVKSERTQKLIAWYRSKRLVASPTVRGDRELLERCAKVAEPWPGFRLDDNSTDVDRAVVAVRTEIAEKIRALSVQPAIDKTKFYAALSDRLANDMIDIVWQAVQESGVCVGVQPGAGERSQAVDINIRRMDALIETAQPENKWEQEAAAEMRKAIVTLAFAPFNRDDVVRLVIAARLVAYELHPSIASVRELDKAAEAFAALIPWDDEPDVSRQVPGSSSEGGR